MAWTPVWRRVSPAVGCSRSWSSRGRQAWQCAVLKPRLRFEECQAENATMVAGSISRWVLLAYRLPREPSTPRIALWRKLRRLGAVQLVDGLVALPATARTREQLDWLADEVVEAAGEAWVWVARAGSQGQERALLARMAAMVAEEYEAVRAEAQAAVEDDGGTRRLVDRLRRELHRIEDRDHVSPQDRERTRR